MTPVPHLALPYDRAAHERFVLDSWVHGVCEHRRHFCRPRRTMADLLRRPEVRCVVAVDPDDWDSLLGWAAALGPVALWVHVRDPFGAGRLRRRGLGTSLLIAAGLDPSQPTPCQFWSPLGSLWASRPGTHLYFAPSGAEGLAA